MTACFEFRMKHVLAPLHSMDLLTLIRHRLCLMTAALIDDNLDTLIVLHRHELAMDFAKRGLELVRLAMDRNERPAHESHRPYSPSEIKAGQYFRLYALSWMVNGTQDDSLLDRAVDYAIVHLEELCASPRSRHVESYRKQCVMELARAGRFKQARDEWSVLAEQTKKRTGSNVSDIWNVDTFIQLILELFTDDARSMAKSGELAALISNFFEGYGYDQQPVKTSFDDACWLAYMAGKYVEPFCSGPFTRPRVIGQLKFSNAP